MALRALTEIHEVVVDEVIVQIFRGDTAKIAVHHVLELQMVVVEKLDVEHLFSVFLRLDADMAYTHVVCQLAIPPVAV